MPDMKPLANRFQPEPKGNLDKVREEQEQEDLATRCADKLLDNIAEDFRQKQIPRPRWITDDQPELLVDNLSKELTKLADPPADKRDALENVFSTKLRNLLINNKKELEKESPKQDTARLDPNSAGFELFDTLTSNVLTLLKNSLPGLFLQTMREQATVDNFMGPNNNNVTALINGAKSNPGSPADTAAELAHYGIDKEQENKQTPLSMQPRPTGPVGS